VIHRRESIGDIPDLTDESFKPRAATPLIDAACVTIDAAKEAYQTTDRVVITIMTDGHENASREFKMEDLRARIKAVSGHGWDFVFLGANIDHYADGERMGLGDEKLMSYDAADRETARNAYRRTGLKTREFFALGASIAFTPEEKVEAGDRYAPRRVKPFIGTLKL
jgi:hypothetical protein